MPLFEFDAGRQLEGSDAKNGTDNNRVGTDPAGNPRNSDSSHTDPARLAQVIEDNLDGLVGEQVFHVVRSFSPSEPFLIALDPSGAPVVVEVVAHLDAAALIRCLDHAGAAGRMTRGQLAGQYPGGRDAFVADLSRFMDSVPVKRARLPRSGSRLIVICHRTDDDVLNAVDFLRQPAMPVEVLHLNMVNGQGGRRYIDLSPLVINPHSAPDRPQLLGAIGRGRKRSDGPGGPQEIPTPGTERRTRLAAAIAAAQQAVQRAEAVIALGVSDTGETPSTPAVTETRRQRRERLAAERAAETATRRAARQQQGDTTEQIPAVTDENTPSPLGDSALDALRGDVTTGESPVAHLPTGLQAGDPLPAVVHPHSFPAGLTIDGVLAAGTDASDPLSWDTSQLPVVVDPVLTGPSPQVAAAQQLGDRPTVRRTPVSEVRRVVTHRAATSDAAESAEQADAPIDNSVDQRLVDLAARLGKETALIWDRPRRRQRFTATLDESGAIHLADGDTYFNPDAAARAAANSRTSDGWNVWRVATADGPTLAEALAS